MEVGLVYTATSRTTRAAIVRPCREKERKKTNRKLFFKKTKLKVKVKLAFAFL